MIFSYRRTYMPASYHIAQELQKYNIPDYRPRQEQYVSWVLTLILYAYVIAGSKKLSRKCALCRGCDEIAGSLSVKPRTARNRIRRDSFEPTTHPRVLRDPLGIDDDTLLSLDVFCLFPRNLLAITGMLFNVFRLSRTLGRIPHPLSLQPFNFFSNRFACMHPNESFLQSTSGPVEHVPHCRRDRTTFNLDVKSHSTTFYRHSPASENWPTVRHPPRHSHVSAFVQLRRRHRRCWHRRLFIRSFVGCTLSETFENMSLGTLSRRTGSHRRRAVAASRSRGSEEYGDGGVSGGDRRGACAWILCR